MGFFGTIFSFFGFGFGISMGLAIGYYLFIYVQPSDVKDPEIKPLAEEDSETIDRMIPEIPLWVKNPDFDRVDWLNKLIEYMWPYLNKAICKTAETIAKPIIEEQIPQYKIDSVEFEELTLGSLPPTFQGMKVYETEEKELIMELSVKWAANPNIIVAVKKFGLKATVQVMDLHVFAIPRITLKPLVPSFPCFANIFVSLMEKPYVDFGLKLVGADLMSIPGLYKFVQEIIKDQVANMYLWPKTLDIQVIDPSKAQKKPVGILNTKVIRAMKLKKKDLLGASDPYVQLTLTEDTLSSKKTTVKHKNLNPEWNEEFTDEPKTFTLELLKNLNPKDAQNEKSRGQIVLELTYKPFRNEDLAKSFKEPHPTKSPPEGTPPGGGLLVVIIHEAQDVEGKYHTNPHVRLIFRGEERRTKIIKKNRDPRWEEEFQFLVEEAPTNDKLHVEVVSTSSRSLLRQKESLGYADISLADVVANNRINERHHLIDSKNGRIQIELQWRASQAN
ncbi:hypothetical protein V8G54_006890 [Vigna mungo]|uniref:Uncharacterized protein n=1 Tax=Vigna mungo TaxID=3915 RepID=A0AAQ3P4B8_VIGMU